MLRRTCRVIGVAHPKKRPEAPVVPVSAVTGPGPNT
jgi:hypothetical protein